MGVVVNGPTPKSTGQFIDVDKGWSGLVAVLGKALPYQLTHGGNARKALYALMYPTRR